MFAVIDVPVSDTMPASVRPELPPTEFDPTTKFVPVSVISTIVPRTPLLGEMLVSVGAGAAGADGPLLLQADAGSASVAARNHASNFTRQNVSGAPPAS